MTKRRIAFKRMVLGLPQSASDYSAVRAAADLADRLGLSLIATFIEDASVLGLGHIPCVRELRPLGGGWRSIDSAQLTRDLEHAAATARRLFAEAVKTGRIETSFEVARGTAADVIASVAQSHDIVVIIEPKNPAERITLQFTRMMVAAFRAASAVMIVPSRIVRSSGPIVAVARGPDDPSIPAALAIAAVTNEHVIVLVAGNRPISSAVLDELGVTDGVTIEEIAPPRAPVDAATLASTLAGLRERLIVMTRGAFDDAVAQTIATSQAIPVLVIEPAAADFDAAPAIE